MTRIDADNDGRFIDLHPLTTREERQTLDKDALDALRAQRRKEREEVRLELRAGRSRFDDLVSRLKANLVRLALRLGTRFDEDALREIVKEAVGRLAQIPDPDEDGWTAAEIAAEVRPIVVDKVDKWFEPVTFTDEVLTILKLVGVQPIEGTKVAVSSFLTGLEQVDGRIADAIIGGPVEDFIEGMLRDPDDDLAYAAGFSDPDGDGWFIA